MQPEKQPNRECQTQKPRILYYETRKIKHRKDKYRVGSKKQVAEKPNSGSQVNKGETVVAL